MQIVCPACASEYEIPTDRVGAEGRSVRCAACRETWFIGPDDVATAQIAEAMAAMDDGTRNRSEDQAALDAWEAALAEEGIAPDAAPSSTPSEPASVEPPPRKAAKRPSRPAKPGRSWSAFATAAGLWLAIVAVGGGALVARTTVVRAMPQSAGLYAAIGLPVNLRGIDLRDVAAFQAAGEAGLTQLVVEGDLVGVSREAVAVPAIEIEVRDERDQPLYRWTVPSPRPSLEDRETARFRASLSAPPAQGRSVQVRFAGTGQMRADAAASEPKADASRRNP
ncbi:zinc-ribbon domain-containing protein [Methylobacterium sp. Leaf466]|uniref:zinc-ribbon domain-containing protein n=1 Tax=Methylobacterium sp. Leaf466 TaxID=1736386 RepID=UPI0007008A93|nr:zinc-ribbon domain-containing protein [Methylobacterium sp. Leaf466]KQT76871.1 hypothetical protein ASG59_12955 [Methylobacterium sp. Leaf466]